MEVKGEDLLALIGEDQVQHPERLLGFVQQEFLKLKVKLAQQSRETQTFMPEAGKVKVAWALHDTDEDLARQPPAVQDVSFTEIQDFDQFLSENVEKQHGNE